MAIKSDFQMENERGNNTSGRRHFASVGRVAEMAAQQKLGLCPERRPGHGANRAAHIVSARSNLTDTRTNHSILFTQEVTK